MMVRYSRYMEFVKSVPGFLRQFPNMEEDELLNTMTEYDKEGKLIHFIEILIMYLNDLLKVKYDSPDVVMNLKELDNLDTLTVLWPDELCVVLVDKLKKVVEDHNLGLNLKPRHLVYPVMMWTFLLMQKHKAKREG